MVEILTDEQLFCVWSGAEKHVARAVEAAVLDALIARAEAEQTGPGWRRAMTVAAWLRGVREEGT